MSNLSLCFPALLIAVGSLLPAQEKQEKAESTPAESATRKIPAVSIGVVDFVKVLDAYPKAIKMGQELQKLRESYGAQIREIEKKMAVALETVKAVGEGTDEGKQGKFEYEHWIQVRSFQAKRMDEKLDIEEMRVHVELHSDMEVAIAKVAKNRGVHLVLRTLDPGPPPTIPDKATPKELVPLRQFAQMYERRQVWFADDAIDLTGDVIKLLQVPLEKDQAPAGQPKAEPPKPPTKEDRGGL